MPPRHVPVREGLDDLAAVAQVARLELGAVGGHVAERVGLVRQHRKEALYCLSVCGQSSLFICSPEMAPATHPRSASGYNLARRADHGRCVVLTT
jgi:hypothetical protein